MSDTHDSGEQKAVAPRGVLASTAVKARALMQKLQDEIYDGSQTKLAEALDMSQPSLSRIMRGGGLDFRTVINIARLSGVQPVELLVDDLGPPVVHNSRYPNLDIALKFALAEEPTRWPNYILVAAREGVFEGPDVKPSVWLRRLDQLRGHVAQLAEIIQRDEGE